MKRALAVIGSVLAVAVIPGALVIVGVVAAYRYCFTRENRVDAVTLRRIRAQSAQAERARELDEARVILPRAAADGPAPSKALSRVNVR